MLTSNLLKNKVFITMAVIVGAVFLSTVTVLSSLSSVKTAGVKQEQQMSATYEDNQNQLSAYLLSFYEQLGLARERTQRGDSILTGALRGRYGTEGFQANGQFFSAIVEAYPDIQGIIGGYDRVMQHVSSGRENFRNRQSILRDQIRSYESWLNEGLFRPLFIRMLGFPSQQMVARIGGKEVAKGQQALEQFHQLVLDEQSVAAFQEGKQAPLIK